MSPESRDRFTQTANAAQQRRDQVQSYAYKARRQSKEKKGLPKDSIAVFTWFKSLLHIG